MLSKMKAMAAAIAVAGVATLAGAGNASALDIGTVGTPIGSGNMPAAATAGPSRLVVNGALPLNCTVTTAATSANIVTGGGFPLPRTVAPIIPTFGTCTGPSGFVFHVTCGPASLEIISLRSAGPPRIWNGRLSGISCVISFTALGCSATASGSVPLAYTNPTASAAAVLTVETVGQALTVSGSTCPSAVLPNGTAQYGAPSGAGTGLANLPYTLNGASTTHPFFT